MTKNEQNRVLAWRLKLLHEASAMPRNVAQAIPAEEAVDNGLNSALSAVSPATTLSPPVTLTYSGSSTAFTITDSGTGRAVQASITDAGSFGIAIYGLTSGTGPAVAGYTTGKSGFGGKFAVGNKNSASAAVFATTAGAGPAVLGTITNTSSTYPAIYGQNNGGIGVEGTGGEYGVYGSGADGVYAYSNVNGGNGLFAHPDSGTGADGFAVWAVADEGYGVVATLDNGGNASAAVLAQDESSSAVGSYGLHAFSSFNTAVYGESDSGVSAEFSGGSAGSGSCSFSGGTGWSCSSDKNLKKSFAPVNATALLDHLAAMPVFE